jgi:hypothetical protein
MSKAFKHGIVQTNKREASVMSRSIEIQFLKQMPCSSVSMHYNAFVLTPTITIKITIIIIIIITIIISRSRSRRRRRRRRRR